jgi:hypothetical protein
MPRVVRLIGYWDGPTVPAGLPDVCDFVSPGSDADARRAVSAYLGSGTVFVATGGVSICRLCGIANGSAELTDGQHFVWPEGLAHYVQDHGVRLPDEILAVAIGGRAPAVDCAWFERAVLHTGEVRIDTGWWSRAGRSTGTEHLRGCRRSAVPASWNLPTTADIYIDKVPPDSVATLVQLRRILGSTWPFAELRGLLATQPCRAVAAGNPKALNRALTASPELRPHLFYDTADGLMPIWVDAEPSPRGPRIPDLGESYGA